MPDHRFLRSRITVFPPSRAVTARIAYGILSLLLIPTALFAQPIEQMIIRHDHVAILRLLKRHPSLVNRRFTPPSEYYYNSDFTPLEMAAAMGDAAIVRILLRAGAHVKSCDAAGKTALHHARNATIANLLIAYGANVDACSKQGTTPLMAAATERRMDVVRVLLAHGANPSIPDQWMRFPMHYVVASGSLPMVKLLVAHGASLAVHDQNESSILHWAVGTSARNGLVQYLLARGLDASGTDRQGETPLHMGTSGPVASLLIACGASVFARDDQGRTPLIIGASSQSDQGDALEVMLQNGAEIDARDNKGRTALHMAVQTGRPCILETLLDHGADPDARDIQGQTPFFSCRPWNGECFAILCRYHASIDIRDNAGKTFLHYAVTGRDTLSAARALRCGADVNARDSAGWTPLHFAVADADTLLTRFLIGNGADLSLANNSGSTPMAIARANAGLLKKHPMESPAEREYRTKFDAILELLIECDSP